MTDITPDLILARVTSSRRYRHVSHAVVLRLAAQEIPKSRNLADAEKRTKRRLHQIFGAYTGQPDYTRCLLELTEVRGRGDAAAVRAQLREMMRLHASTRERLPVLDSFYDAIFAVTGAPSAVLDIACGLNPLAAPWMHLADDARYVAWDIDAQLLGFVAGCLDVLGVGQRTELRDVVAEPPDAVAPVDVAFLLKAVPCLDQQHPEATERILRGLRARYIVVSFPTQSLGGRGKGMAQTYRARFITLLQTLGWQDRVRGEVEVAGELAFIVAGSVA